MYKINQTSPCLCSYISFGSPLPCCSPKHPVPKPNLTFLLDLIRALEKMATVNEHEIGSFIRNKLTTLLQGASSLKAGLSDNILSFFPNKSSVGLQLTTSESVTDEACATVRRQQLLARLLSACLGLAVSVALSYFSIQWLSKAMDPTRRERKEAQKRVSVCFVLVLIMASRNINRHVTVIPVNF